MTADPLDPEARYWQTCRDVGRWIGVTGNGATIEVDPERWAVHVTLTVGEYEVTVQNLQQVPRPLLHLCLDLTARQLARRVRDDLWAERWTTTPDRCEAMLDQAAAEFLGAIEAYERDEPRAE